MWPRPLAEASRPNRDTLGDEHQPDPGIVVPLAPRRTAENEAEIGLVPSDHFGDAAGTLLHRPRSAIRASRAA